MATRTEVIEHKVCDQPHMKQGEAIEVEATEERDFSINGKSFHKDLCSADARKFDSMFEPLMEHAAPVRSKGTRQRIRNRQPAISNNAVRAWAAEKGITVSSQGRIAESVVAQYRADTGK